MVNIKMSEIFQTTLPNLIENSCKYLWEKERRASFTSWVFSDDCKCNVSKLSEAGFVFMGSASDPDSVVCFLCQKSLDCWDEDDDPWTEHLKHSKHCNFAEKGKKEDEYTLTEFIDIKNELNLKILEKCKEQHLQAVTKVFDALLKDVLKRN